MPLETGTYINSLNSSNPVATDGLAFADEHFRLIKATILATFPNITGEMSATHTVLNGLDARVTAIESGVHASGTKMLFQQTAAPTGWTKDTTNYNDHAIRVVTGTASSGGTNALSTLDATASGTINSSISGSVAHHAITAAQMPAHRHYVFRSDIGNLDGGPGNVTAGNFACYANNSFGGGDEKYSIVATGNDANVALSSSAGSSQGHSHGVGSLAVTSTFTGSANALDVQYVDVIIATKD